MRLQRAHQNTSKAQEGSWRAASLFLNYRGEALQLFCLAWTRKPDADQPSPVMRQSWAGRRGGAERGQL